jgi:hypothetical protein
VHYAQIPFEQIEIKTREQDKNNEKNFVKGFHFKAILKGYWHCYITELLH